MSVRMDEVLEGEGKVYIVSVIFPSDRRIDFSEVVDERTIRIHLAYDEETRRKITNIRNRYKLQIDKETITYFRLRFTDEEGLEKIREIREQAEKELKQIDPSLRVYIEAIEISQEVYTSTLKQKLALALQSVILKKMYTRLRKIKSEDLKDKSKDSIEKMLEEFKRLNIIRDPVIDEMIEQIRQNLDRKVAELRDSIVEQLSYIEKELEDLI